ncbi:MAG: TlpA family protein disulfide reductase [Chloroflexota bacterium]
MRSVKVFAVIIALVLTIGALRAEEARKLPNARVKNLKGELVETGKFENGGKPMIISFWATWCKPCLSELIAMNELYEKWQEETGVKIIGVSVDDTRSSKKVAPFVKGRGWKFDVYLDENKDFQRALNVNNPPHTFLINAAGEIVFEHTGYASGDEKLLHDELLKLMAK